MIQIKRLSDLDDEITGLQTKLALQRLVITEKLRPANLFGSFLNKSPGGVKPENRELLLNGVRLGIDVLAATAMKKMPNHTRSVVTYIMDEVAKNIILGQSDPWVSHIKSFLNLAGAGQTARTNEGLSDEHFHDVVEK